MVPENAGGGGWDIPGTRPVEIRPMEAGPGKIEPFSGFREGAARLAGTSRSGEFGPLCYDLIEPF